MTIADIKKGAEQRMQKSIESLKSDLSKIRTGRAHTGLIDHVMVDYYAIPRRCLRSQMYPFWTREQLA
jgi:ribosome recycling factor